jgi:hypothetical protein
MTYTVSDAVVEQRRDAATTHGGRSETRVNRVATVQKRRLLRQIGLRQNQLDGIAQGYLDSWARAQSKVELMDAWSAEHGWLDREGKPPAFVNTYFAAVNSARLSLAKLEGYLRDKRDLDVGLAALIESGRAIRERRELPPATDDSDSASPIAGVG